MASCHSNVIFARFALYASRNGPVTIIMLNLKKLVLQKLGIRRIRTVISDNKKAICVHQYPSVHIDIRGILSAISCLFPTGGGAII